VKWGGSWSLDPASVLSRASWSIEARASAGLEVAALCEARRVVLTVGDSCPGAPSLAASAADFEARAKAGLEVAAPHEAKRVGLAVGGSCFSALSSAALAADFKARAKVVVGVPGGADSFSAARRAGCAGACSDSGEPPPKEGEKPSKWNSR